MSVSADRGFDFAGTERFQVLRCLGAGGMGVVYEAYDRERQSRVALKTLRSMSPEGLLRFKREFRDFLDVTHPNLISLGELFSEGRDWFFTMELVDGLPFLDWVRPGPADSPTLAPLDVARLRVALAQLAEGMMALHAVEKVHRDIKPSNVLITASGRLVLLDFGLAVEARREEQLSSTDVVGTVEYMAPEQAAARPIGPPADWYAVGVMLYEALTGQVPFSGPALEVLMNKQRLEPMAPSQLVPSTPPELDRLALDLLRFDPARRPDGIEILRRLGLKPVPADRNTSRPSLTQTPPFVGRAGELVALRQAYEASRGGAVTVHVHGESGVGKSALVRRFVDMLRAEVPDAVVLGGACYERESVPYKAVDGVIDALSRYLVKLDKADSASVLPRQAALLTSVFPVLSRVEPFADAPRGQEVRDPQEMRARLFGALRELFLRLGDRRPLVVTIDDLQWADADSLALLAELLRPPEAPALLLVATVRDRSVVGEASGPHAVNPALAELRQLKLERMPLDEARELAQLLIARVAGRPDIDARAVAEEAGGHPLFIDELIRHSDADAAPALHLEDALWSRISRLEPAARAVLELTALAGGRLVQATAAQAANLDAASFGKQVGLLRVAHLVRTTGTRGGDFIEPYHDRVRGAVLAHLVQAAASAQHRRLALALEASNHADPEALALHWREAGERARAAEYASQAALKAARALAFDRAAQLYGDCLALGLSRDDGGRDLRVLRADALANAGRGADAAALYLEAAASASPADALDLRRRAAEQLLRSGHVDDGLAALRTVLGAVGMRFPSTPARALTSLLFKRAHIRLRGLKFAERDESQISAEMLTRIDTCWSAASGLSMVDTIRSADFQARHMLLALEAGEPYRVARALAMEGGLMATSGVGAEKQAKKTIGEAMALARRIGHPHAIGMAELVTGVAAYQCGRWAESVASMDRAEAIFRNGCVGVAWETTTAVLFRTGAQFYLGDLAGLQKAVPAAIRGVEGRGDLYASTTLRIRPMSFAALAADDVPLARWHAEEGMRLWTPEGYHAQHHYHMVAVTNADLYEGDGKAAWERITKNWKSLARSLFMRVQVVRIEAVCMRARAALAAAAATKDLSLLREATAAAAKLEREGAAWATALARLLRAGVASLRGDEAAMHAELDAAAGEFAHEDMQLYAAVAQRKKRPAAADAWMAGQRIRNPDRQAAMLAPGVF